MANFILVSQEKEDFYVNVDQVRIESASYYRNLKAAVPRLYSTRTIQ